MGKTCALSATEDHPIDCGHLVIEERPRLRSLKQSIYHFRVALHFLGVWVETGEMHGDERYLLEYRARAALGDLPVIVRGRDLPITRVALFTDCIQAAHEFGGVFRIAELLERMGERRDPSFFILLAGRSRIAFDRINHLSGDRESLEVEPRQAET
jgi:hypothetical protein